VATTTAAAPLIVIIDDDASIRTALTMLLRSFGYQARDYDSADAFWSAGPVAEIACIVTDINMPGLSGIDLKHRLTAEGHRTPVIMITGRTEDDLHQRAQASGATCVLKKPFAADTLIGCIKKALAS
jgi:FixJ family two-component response regulator